MVKIQEDIKRDILTLTEFASDSASASERINKLKECQSNFEKVLILPGMEFEANPGIHLLFIFDPSKDLSVIDKFLLAGGYSESEQGAETVTANINWDVLTALSKAKEIGAITIAAHVDSDKGVYNALSGNYRARVFTSEALDAISVNSTVNMDKIRSMLGQSEYRRSSPLAFVQSSDHHQQIDCARMLTYVKLDHISFPDLVAAIKDPMECISPTAAPEVKQIIDKITNDPTTIIFEKFVEVDFYKAVCAVLNHGYGSIILGVSEDHYKNVRGVAESEDTIKGAILGLKERITPGSLFYEVKLKKWEWGKNRVYVLVLNNNSRKQFYLDGVHFHNERQHAIISDAEYLLNRERKEDRFSEELVANHFDELKKMSDKMILLVEQQHVFPIVHKIEMDGVKLSAIIDLEVREDVLEEPIEKQSPFGNSKGCIFGIQGYERVRAEDYYVRVTPFRLPSSCSVKKDNELPGPGIIVVPGGGSFFVDEKVCYIYNLDSSSFPFLYFRLSDNFTNLNIYAIVAWLKSSVFLWYISTAFGETDLYYPHVFNNVYIPAVLFEDTVSSQLQAKIEEIVNKEKCFLSKQEQVVENNVQEGTAADYWEECAKSHNQMIDRIAAEIDDIINTSLSMGPECTSFLQHFLKLGSFHPLNNTD